MITEPFSTARAFSGRFTPHTRQASPPAVELSVVIPSLDQAETLVACITRARRALDASGITGEIVVADRGSRDGSPELAESLGARVVKVRAAGHGSALMAGVDASLGRYVLVGEGDGRYDFAELPRFVAKLRDGYDLVQGCRLPRGGGSIARGAMTSFERWCAVPASSWVVRRRFAAPVSDVHCGMRAFTRTLYQRIGQRCTGSEFGLESIVRAGMAGARIGEVPITLRREAGLPRTRMAASDVRDALRHLRVHLLRRA